MKIEKLKIKNFRGFEDLKIENIPEKSQIIGKNDSGKTTIFKAIAKVLNKKERKKDLLLEDGTDCNKEDIEIEIVLDFGDVISTREENKEKYINVFPNLGFDYKLLIKLHAFFDEVEEKYEEKYFINSEEVKNKFKNLPTDQFIEVIYINPIYNLEDAFENTIREQVQKDEKEDKKIDFSDISLKTQELNEAIRENEQIKQIQQILNTQKENLFILNKSDVKIESKFEVNNIYKNLILNEFSNEKKVFDSGDGKKKVLSNQLNIEAPCMNSKEKEIIVLLEEPETHLFVDYQKSYIDDILKNDNIGQLIVSSHSPFIVNYKKDFGVIKLFDNKNSKLVKCVDNNFGYFYSTKMSEMFYYDNILCVEGPSEEILYDYLSYISKEFREFLIKKNIGIFNIYGIGFEKYKKSFEDLGINILIKTDNDIFKVQNNEEYRFAGIERGLKYIKNKETFFRSFNVIHENVLSYENEEIKLGRKLPKKISNWSELGELEEPYNKLLGMLEEENIFISKQFDGLEGDLQNLLEMNDEQKESLKKKKAENLYEFLNEEEITEKLNEIITEIIENIETEKYKGNTILNFIFKINEETND